MEHSDAPTEVLPGMKGRYQWGAPLDTVLRAGLDEGSITQDVGLALAVGERNAGRRRMKRAQKAYSRTWYMSRSQLVLLGVSFAGSVVLVGSAIGGLWIWLGTATGVCQ